MAFRALRRIQSHSWYQSLFLQLRSSQWLLTELAAHVDRHVRGSSMWKPLAPRLSSALPSVAERMLYSKIHMIVVLVAMFSKPRQVTKLRTKDAFSPHCFLAGVSQVAHIF